MQTFPVRFFIPGALSVGLIAVGPAWAQYQGAFGTTWNNPISAQISHYIQGNMQSMQLRNALVGQLTLQSSLKPGGGKGKPAAKPPVQKPTTKPATKPSSGPTATKSTTSATPPSAPDAGPGTTTFQAIPARVLPAKFAEQYGKTPEERKRLEGLLHQVLNNWETQALTRQGLGRFSELWDLSKAVPYAVAVTHGVYRGNGAPPSREMIQAAQRTLGEQIRQSPTIGKMTDLQKQEIYETQAVMTFLLESGRQAAANTHNLEAERKIQDMAGRFLTAMVGEDPEKIELSNDGFAIKK